ncbi:MAG: DUF2310 family Zn-ribbon-containing protein [Phycisphaerae bacterium]|nr:DUF2310 family Zn-ribbon-containing protein [Phycisphaerae bacterium]
MYTAELVFKRERGVGDSEDCVRPIRYLLVALGRNGQLIEIDAPMANMRGGYRLYVSLAEADSLRPRLYNRHVRAALRSLRQAGVKWHATRPIGPDPESDPVCTCRRSTAYILETDFLTCETPVVCGDCRGVVPLYRIPHTSECDTYEDIIFWAYHLRAFDSVWIHSGAGEKLAYRELSRHDSETATSGREICRRIEKLSNTPAYYSLLTYYGRNVTTERRRLCPSCGGKWLLDEPWLGKYQFRCDKCRLVTTVACDVL